MELKAKLVQLLPLQTGSGKNGEWKKQDIIVETLGSQFPKKICISIWGDKADTNMLQIGNELNISFDVESREYNGRWYTDVKAWKVEAAGAGSNRSNDEQPPIGPPPPFEDEEDELPF
jgi:hypothetical protein